MKRSMISIALLIAGLAVVTDASTAEARGCRTHRNRCCRSNSSGYAGNSGYGGNSGYVGNAGYQMGSQNSTYGQTSGGYVGGSSLSPIMNDTNANPNSVTSPKPMGVAPAVNAAPAANTVAAPVPST